MITGAQLLHDIWVNTDIEPLEFDGEWIGGLGVHQFGHRAPAFPAFAPIPALIAADCALTLDDKRDDDGHMIYLWAKYAWHADNTGRDGAWEQIGGEGAGTESEAREAVERWLRDV